MIRRLHERWRSYNRRRRALVVIGIVLAVVLTPALVVLALAKLDPAWWPAPSATPRETSRQAESLENAALAQASLVRPTDATATRDDWFSEPWSVAINESDANAWLEARLPKWLANRYPRAAWAKSMGTVRVRFRENRIDIAARLGDESGSRIAGVTLNPSIDEAGALWAPATTVFAGRAQLPADLVMRGLRGRVQAMLPNDIKNLPEVEAAIDQFLGEHAAAASPVLRIDNGRRVRLLDIRAREGRIELTCRTEQR